MKQIILIGFMGAGKTTIGRLLSQALGLSFTDIDQLIVDRIKMPISDYFSQFGEGAFRELEKATLAELAATSGVIATGGGIVTSEANRLFLAKMPCVIFLQADPKVTLKRITSDHQSVRPLALEKSAEELICLFESRRPYYEMSATDVVETSNLTPQEVVTLILEKVEQRSSKG